MLRFKIDLRMKETIKAKCPRHPKFDPSIDERMGSEPGCSACSDIRSLQDARVALENAARGFERRAYQWRLAGIRKSRP